MDLLNLVSQWFLPRSSEDTELEEAVAFCYNILQIFLLQWSEFTAEVFVHPLAAVHCCGKVLNFLWYLGCCVLNLRCLQPYICSLLTSSGFVESQDSASEGCLDYTAFAMHEHSCSCGNMETNVDNKGFVHDFNTSDT